MRISTPASIIALTALLGLLTTQPAQAQARQDIAGNYNEAPTAGPIEAPATHAAPKYPAKPIDRTEHQAFHQAVDLEPLAALAVFDDGRVKTLDTLAREHVARFNGRTHLRDIVAVDAKLPPGQRQIYKYDHLFAFFDVAFRDPTHHDSYLHSKPLVYVESLPLRRQLIAHLPPEEQELWKVRGRLSPAMLLSPPVLANLRSETGDLREANAKGEVWLAYTAMRDTTDRLNLISPPPSSEAWAHIDSLDPMHRSVKTDGDANQPAAIFTAANPDAAVAAREAFIRFREAWLASDAEAVNAAAYELLAALPNINPTTYPEPTRRAVEVMYNRTGRYAMGWLLFAAAAVCMILAASTGRRLAIGFGVGLLGLGMLTQLAGLVTRTVISGRWPIHNQYESFMAIAFFAVAFGFALTLIKRQWLFGAAAAGVGAVALMFAHFVPTAFPTKAVANDMPILATSNILFVHVNVVLFSYGLIALAFFISLIYLAIHYFSSREVAKVVADSVTPSAVTTAGKVGGVNFGPGAMNADEPTASSSGAIAAIPKKKALLHDLDTAQLIVMQLAFWLLGVGIILGAYWADHAWGRWWAWDPKETWALITWIVYLIAIHARFGVKNRGLTTAWLGVIGFFVMLWCYWGVNLFLA
ncbi:MAG: cytochrome c biogenesis protein CcsA, partial [Planctomycetota bacterium]